MALETRGEFAVMAIDPGETTGIATMHVYVNRKTGKLPDHAVVRHRAWEETPPGNPKLADRYEAMLQTKRQWPLPLPTYLQYTRMARRLANLWIRFRRTSCGRYGIPEENTILVFEDWIMPPQIKTRKRETLSPVFVAQQTIAMLYAYADDYETLGYGPAHVGSTAFISPSEKSSDMIFTDEKLDRAGLLLKPKTRFPHANDATRIGLAFLRKHPNVPGLLTPYAGEQRPDPMGARYRPPDEAPIAHLTDEYVADPADPVPVLPKRKRALSRAGQPSLAKAAAEATIAEKGYGRDKPKRNKFNEPVAPPRKPRKRPRPSG